MIEVLQPGLLTTVQDLGRHGLTHLGISPAGACDSVALRIGNMLVGNDENAPALEFSFNAGAFRFERRVCVAITGAECEAAPARCWDSFHVEAGQVLRAGNLLNGAHAYLCVSGGIKVELVLGSAATHLPSKMGGVDGRALQKGDRLELGACSAIRNCVGTLPRQFEALTTRTRKLRVTRGAHMEAFSAASVFDFLALPFKVATASNRQGLRISGPKLAYPGEVVSEGVTVGNIQVLPNGDAVILSVDSQTTGGYPVIASVVCADWPSLGQLRPGDDVTFEAVSLQQAIDSVRAQEKLIDELRQVLA